MVVPHQSAVRHVHPVNKNAVVGGPLLQECLQKVFTLAAVSKNQKLVKIKERHPCVLAPESAVTVVVGVVLCPFLGAIAEINNRDETLSDEIAEHVLEALFTVVVVVVNINMVKTECAVVGYPFGGVLVLAPSDGAKSDAVVHIIDEF